MDSAAGFVEATSGSCGLALETVPIAVPSHAGPVVEMLGALVIVPLEHFSGDAQLC